MKKTKIAWIIGFTIITVVVLFLYAVSMKETTEKLIEESIHKQVTQYEQYISSSFRYTMNALQGITNTLNDEYPQLETEDVNSYINLYEKNGEYSYLLYADDNGALYTDNSKKLDITDLSWYRDAKKKDQMIGFWSHSELDGESYVVFTKKISKSGQDDMLIACISANTIQSVLMKEFGTKEDESVIINRDGEILLASEEVKISNDIFEGKNLYEHIKIYLSEESLDQIKDTLRNEKTNVVFFTSVQGGYIAYKEIEGTNGWAYISYVKPSIYESYSRRIMTSSALTVSIIALIVGFLSFYIFDQEKKKKKDLEAIQLQDKLTQLSNEFGFYDRIQDRIKEKQDSTMALIIFDLNNFKLVNHNFSYRVGDDLLIQISRILSQITEGADNAARIGADNFGLIVEYSPEIISRIFNQIYDGIRKEMGDALAKMLHFTIGYYVIQNPDEKVRFMMDKANYAWKYAKQHHLTEPKEYDDEILEYEMKLKRIESSQQSAIERNEFAIYLQPKVDLKTNKTIGAEALVRWISNDYGFMPPDDFIPIFENNGFVKEVDFFVLETVCKDIRRKLDLGETPVTISINQSRITILEENYIKRLTETIQKYNVPKEYLDLEVTESLFIGDYNEIISILKVVKEMGISISMDDFGSGYSSLNLLKVMPIDNLKIDKEFLDETSNSVQSRIIIRSVIEMAKHLQMRVICEGVETWDQVRFLKEINCDIAQGYYYDRPIPMETFNKKLINGEYLTQ